jgi:hypothetical protein
MLKESRKKLGSLFSESLFLHCFLSILLVLCLTGNAFSLVEKLSVEQMTQRADVIIKGTVVNMESRWEDVNGGKGIFTYVNIAVSEYIKGTGANVIGVKVPGGTVGDITERVSDTPQFNPNEEVIVFLRPQFFQIVGWSQGKFSIRDNTVLENHVPVQDFINMIKSIIQESPLGPKSALQTQIAQAQQDSASRETPNIGIPMQAVLDSSQLQPLHPNAKHKSTSESAVVNEGKLDSWYTIMTEGFEGAFPSGSWALSGNPTWDDDDYKPYSGSRSAWCARGGSLGLDPQYSYYPNNMNAFMTYGPFSLSDAVDAELLFYYWNRSELNYDKLFWGASTNGTNFYGTAVSGDSGGWIYVNFDLTNVYTLGNLTGHSNVWIGFQFTSDATNVSDGAFVDNIVLQKNIGGGPNLTPYNPSGWSDKIVVSKTQGTHSDDSPLYATDTLYVDWAVINNGTGAVTSTFYTKLYVDDVEKTSSYTSPPLNPNAYAYFNDYSIGSLSAGTHTIKIVADYNNLIPETNESDNEYVKTINIQPPVPGPHISNISPSIGSAGTDTTVTIYGTNFVSTQGNGKVEFFFKTGQPKISAPIVSWGDTQVACKVPTDVVNNYPASASSGPVTVTTDGGTSNGYNFSVTFGYGGVEWPTVHPNVTYEINENAPNCTGEGPAVITAANAWNNAGAKFTFAYDGPTTATGYSFNGHNEITWSSTGGSIATTHYWSSGTTMLECDTIFDNSYQWGTDGSANKMDVQNTVTHELGHWLNLRDLYGDIGNGYDTEKTMYGFGTEGETKRRTLHTDDVAGIQWIYGIENLIGLTVSKAGTGSGTVTSSPAGIDCGSTCSASFNSGTVVTLTASPTGGSSFGGWSGACTGTGSCQVTMNQAQSVTATFNPPINTPHVDLGSGGGGRGATVQIPITLTNVTGTSIASIGMDIGYDTNVLGSPAASIGPAGSAAGKSVSTSTLSPGLFRIGILGFNTTAIGNGVVAYVSFTINSNANPGATTLTNTPSAADTTGNSVTVTGAPGAITVTTCTKAGDLNGDGAVLIAEVQSAINMYLGINPVSSCVDTDSSGVVTIAEVQKVVNNYLGI